MMGQLSRKKQQAEMDWVQRQQAEARVNVSAPIADYTRATMFDLIAHADVGDAAASYEIQRRKSY